MYFNTFTDQAKSDRDYYRHKRPSLNKKSTGSAADDSMVAWDIFKYYLYLEESKFKGIVATGESINTNADDEPLEQKRSGGKRSGSVESSSGANAVLKAADGILKSLKEAEDHWTVFFKRLTSIVKTIEPIDAVTMIRIQQTIQGVTEKEVLKVLESRVQSQPLVTANRAGHQSGAGYHYPSFNPFMAAAVGIENQPPRVGDLNISVAGVQQSFEFHSLRE
jgi:hypothetical protein